MFIKNNYVIKRYTWLFLINTVYQVINTVYQSINTVYQVINSDYQVINSVYQKQLRNQAIYMVLFDKHCLSSDKHCLSSDKHCLSKITT